MSEYIFRFPSNIPSFTFQALWTALALRHKAELKIGKTVTVRMRSGKHDTLEVNLYDWPIAYIQEDSVTFLPRGDDAHQATTEWIALIARHNGIASSAGRLRRRKKDGPGIPVARGIAGVLSFDWCRDKPVVETSYPVNLENRKNTLWWFEREEERQS